MKKSALFQEAQKAGGIDESERDFPTALNDLVEKYAKEQQPEWLIARLNKTEKGLMFIVLGTDEDIIPCFREFQKRMKREKREEE